MLELKKHCAPHSYILIIFLEYIKKPIKLFFLLKSLYVQNFIRLVIQKFVPNFTNILFIRKFNLFYEGISPQRNIASKSSSSTRIILATCSIPTNLSGVNTSHSHLNTSNSHRTFKINRRLKVISVRAQPGDALQSPR